MTRAPLLLALLLSACQPALERQPKLDAFAAPRPPPPGTIAFGDTGATGPPPPRTRALLERGRERYDIYCAVCHDWIGEGHGMAVQRGFPAPPSLQSERARAFTDARLFQVITEGDGVMRAFKAEIRPEDRWAIVAFVRALQFSQHVPADQLSSDDRRALARGTP